MIVDDEHIVREGIRYIFEQDFQEEVTVVYMAKTGREAIEKFEELRPHLVIMDIQMPGINGIEATKEIRRIDPNAKIVIVSAYEQFEYAKDAVQLGAIDYLLKPIHRQKLKKIVQRVIDDIIEVRRGKLKERENQEKLEEVIPILETGYIYSILMNHDYQTEISKYHRLLGIKKEKGYIMVIEFGDGENLETFENRIGIGVRSTSFYKRIRHSIQYKCHGIVGPLMINRLIMSVHEEQPDKEYERRLKALELAERIQQDLEAIVGMNVYIGIGRRYDKEQLNISYSEAIKALNSIEGERILHIGDCTIKEQVDMGYTFANIKKDIDVILKLVEDGRSHEVEKAVYWFFINVHKAYGQQIDMIKNIVTEMFVLVSSKAYQCGYKGIDVLHFKYLDRIHKCTDFYMLQNWCMAELVMIAKNLEEIKKNQVSDIMKKAVEYIQKNYSQDLRLKEVAEWVQMSPQYFSKIFKDNLGVNFIEYLTNLRMEYAKKMLKESDKTIKEICFESGYNDPNYFSRLFKKHVGVTPTEFT